LYRNKFIVLIQALGTSYEKNVYVFPKSGTPRATSPTWVSAVPFDGVLFKDGTTAVRCEIFVQTSPISEQKPLHWIATDFIRSRISATCWTDEPPMKLQILKNSQFFGHLFPPTIDELNKMWYTIVV